MTNQKCDTESAVTGLGVLSTLNGERFDDITHSTNELRQRWDDRLRFPLSDLGERYVRGDLMVLLDLSADRNHHIARNRLTLGIRKCSFDDVHPSTSGKVHLSGRGHEDKLPMFIESVHIVDDKEGVIRSVGPSLVRLQPINDGEDSGIRNSLYFSFVFGFRFFSQWFSENRELQSVWMVPPSSGAGKVPDDMVETGSQMMHNLPGQNTKTEGKSDLLMVVNRLLPRLVLWIGNDWVWAFLKEDANLAFKIDDVLIGPF